MCLSAAGNRCKQRNEQNLGQQRCRHRSSKVIRQKEGASVITRGKLQGGHKTLGGEL